jgi:hypothetical protein
VDALGESGPEGTAGADVGPEIGLEMRAKVEARLRQLEGKAKTSAGSSSIKAKSGTKKFDFVK